MAKKSSLINKGWQLLIILIATFAVIKGYQLYRQSQYEEPISNIQVGKSYEDTTYGYAFTFPTDGPWNVIRYDEVEVRIGMGDGWDDSFGIYSIQDEDDRYTETKENNALKNQQLIEDYNSKTTPEEQFASVTCESFDDLSTKYCEKMAKFTTSTKLPTALPAFLFDTKNISSGEICSGLCYIHDLYVKLDNTFVRMYRDGPMNESKEVDIASLANNIKAIPITTGLIRGNRMTPGKITLYHKNKKTPAAFIYIQEGDVGFRLAIKPGKYFVKDAGKWQKVVVELGKTTRLNLEEFQ